MRGVGLFHRRSYDSERTPLPVDHNDGSVMIKEILSKYISKKCSRVLDAQISKFFNSLLCYYELCDWCGEVPDWEEEEVEIARWDGYVV